MKTAKKNTASRLPAGPPRKYYSLSAQGRAFQLELKGTWENLNNAVEQLTSTPS